MTIVGEAFVQIKPKVNPGEFSRDAEKAIVKPMEGVAKKVTGLLASAFIGQKVAQFFKGAIDKASDLGESLSKNKVVFGQASAAVEKFGQTSADKLGISQRAAAEATGVFGNLLRAVGLTENQAADFSVQMTTLAADLASFNNTSVDEALTALRSGLVGESEPLKRFGVNIDEARLKHEAFTLGLSDGSGPLDASAKAQAAYAAIMKDTALAQGDAVKTGGELAGQQKRLQAKLDDTTTALGAKLLPIALKVTSALSGLVDKFGALPDGAQVAIIGVAAFVAVLGPIISVASNVKTAINAVTSAFQKMSGASAATVGRVSAVTGALIGITAAYLLFKNSQDKAAAAAKELAKVEDPTNLVQLQSAIDKTTAKLDGMGKGFAAGSDVGSRLARVVGGLAQGIDIFHRNSIADGRSAIDAYNKELAGLGETYRNVELNTARLGKELGLTREDVILLASKVGIDLTKALDEGAVPALQKGRDAAANATPVTEKLGDAAAVVGSKVESAAKKLEGFKDIIEATIGVAVDQYSASTKLADSQQSLADAYTDAGGRADINTAKGRKLRDALVDITSAIGDQITAYINAGTVSDDVRDRTAEYRNQLVILAERFPLLGRDVAKFIQTLDKVPGVTQADIRLNAIAALDALDAYEAAAAKAKRAVDLSTPASEALGEAIRVMGDKTSSATDRLHAYKDALDATLGLHLNAYDAATRLADSEAALGQAYLDAGGSSSIATEKGRALRDSLSEVVRAMEDQITAFVESGATQQDVGKLTAEYQQRLKDLGGTYPGLKGDIQGFITKLDQVPKTTNTKASVDTQAAEDTLTRFAGVLARFREANKSIDFFAAITDPITDPYVKRASGGRISAGTPYWVGEQGPEPFVADRGGYMLNRGDAMAAVRSASVPTAAASSSTATGGGPLQAVFNTTVNVTGRMGEDEAAAVGQVIGDEAAQAFEKRRMRQIAAMAGTS